MPEISLSDLKRDSGSVEIMNTTESLTSKQGETEEIINRSFTPKDQNTPTKPAMQTEFRKMNIGATPKEISVKQFKSDYGAKISPTEAKAIDDLNSGVERIMRRIDRNSEEIMRQYDAEEKKALELGIIRPKKERPKTEEEINISIMDDDPYADDKEEEVTMLSKANNQISQEEQDVVNAGIQTSLISDDDFEAMMSDIKNDLYVDDGIPEVVQNPTEKKEDLDVTTDKTNSGVENTIVTLPVSNPAVDFDDDFDDDPYDDEDDDASDIEEDVDSDANESKLVEKLKAEVKEKIKPISKPINLNNFSIRKKPVKASSVMKMASSKINISDWVLPSAGKCISVSELSGMDIVRMNPDQSGQNQINTMRTMYHIMYDHIQDPNKGDFDSWCKGIAFSDVAHLQFGLYKATFEHSNFWHCECQKCKNIDLTAIPLMDMVNFDDDAAKSRFDKIIEKSSVTPEEGYNVNLIQASDDHVFALKLPSVYNIITEIASLPREFANKYSDLIDIVTFIDEVYIIDRDEEILVPVSTNPVKGDITKTCSRKIRIYNDILKTLNSVQYSTLLAKIGEMNEAHGGITYKIPDTKCSKCGETISGQEDVNPAELLFTRHRLGLISSI